MLIEQVGHNMDESFRLEINGLETLREFANILRGDRGKVAKQLTANAGALNRIVDEVAAATKRMEAPLKETP